MSRLQVYDAACFTLYVSWLANCLQQLLGIDLHDAIAASRATNTLSARKTFTAFAYFPLYLDS